MFQYEAKLLRLIDGDTMIFDIDLGFKIHTEIDVRLARIDTPETVNYTAKGIADPAKIYIMQNMPVGSVCVVNISRAEKYGRWLADVFFQTGEVDRDEIMLHPRCLNDELVRNGLARLYDGGKK